ncbi:MAG: sigma-70 family RNA polymerase sigma factor [Planctomycetota bacterium]
MAADASNQVEANLAAPGPLPADTQAIARARAGDADAFHLLVVRYQDRIYNMILRMVNHPDDAADLTQEVFLCAFEKLRSFGGRARFYTWLYRIAANRAISFLRKNRSSREVRAPEDASDAFAAPADPPSARIEKQERARRVEKALARLDDDLRAVVVLRDIENVSYEEIASALGAKMGTVKSRLHRAREALRKSLSELMP